MIDLLESLLSRTFHHNVIDINLRGYNNIEFVGRRILFGFCPHLGLPILSGKENAICT